MTQKYSTGTQVRRIAPGNLSTSYYNEIEGKVFTITNRQGFITINGDSGQFTESYLDEHFEILEVLNRSALKTGMVIEFDHSIKLMLVTDSLFGTYLVDEDGENHIFHIDNYDNNLQIKTGEHLIGSPEDYSFENIYRVWKMNDINDECIYDYSEIIDMSDNLLWENPKHKPREMTILEIEAELGYAIKIIKD